MISLNQRRARVEAALGPAAATLFIEEGSDRHFIETLTLSAVALYLLGKYLDGFIRGLGIEDLGERHGKAVAHLVGELGNNLSQGYSFSSDQLERQTETVDQAIAALQHYRTNPLALENGTLDLVTVLKEKGLPTGEAQRISQEIGATVWTD